MADPHDIELMQHADGELAQRASTEMQATVERDRDARAKIEAIAEIGELVRGHVELSADAVPQARFDAMWRELDKVIANAAPGPAVERASQGAGPGAWKRITGWFDRHRGHIITGAVSAGVVAAFAIVIGPSGGGRDGGVASTNGPIEVRPAALRSLPAVESLDTPGGSGNVLEIDDEDGHMAVIWVTPADTVEGI